MHRRAIGWLVARMMQFDGKAVLLTGGRDCLHYRDEVRTTGASVEVVDINSKSCAEVAEHIKSRSGAAINVVGGAAARTTSKQW
jgi:NAD(P)-dependent dehydrogenase (short-subunit alcohol dehydrogenase family)